MPSTPQTKMTDLVLSSLVNHPNLRHSHNDSTANWCQIQITAKNALHYRLSSGLSKMLPNTDMQVEAAQQRHR